MVRLAKEGEKWEDRNIIKSIKPPFLFRAASNDPENPRASRGLNTANVIDPLYGTHYEYHDNLASIDSTMISNHINYYYHLPSEFSSWSVSLLFVLQHAIRKAYVLGEKYVMIYAMDTSTLSESRVHYAPDLLAHYGIGWKPYRDSATTLSTYTEGEYLVRGRLTNERGLWHAVMFNDLLPSIETVFPSLIVTKAKDVLRARVLQIRKEYFSQSSVMEDIHPLVMNDILKMARKFGKDLEGAVALALFSTRRRSLLPFKVEQLQEHLASIRLPRLSLPTDPRSRLAARCIHHQWQGIQEARQFMEVLLLLDEQTKKRGREDEIAELAVASKRPTLQQLRHLRLLANLKGVYGQSEFADQGKDAKRMVKKIETKREVIVILDD